jgi:hypothetical protein
MKQFPYEALPFRPKYISRRRFLRAAGGLCAGLFGGCGNHESSTRSLVDEVGPELLRKDCGRLNRDYFGSPGTEFLALKTQLWPKSFTALNPLRVTVYPDGATLALGGDAGTTEWGVFVVPQGLLYAPPNTATIRYSRIRDGVFFYVNQP